MASYNLKYQNRGHIFVLFFYHYLNKINSDLQALFMWTWLQQDDRPVHSLPSFYNLLKIFSNCIGKYFTFMFRYVIHTITL